MAAIIDSSPECVTNEEVVGGDPASEAAVGEDSLDFILQANYEDCAGFMTFGPGSTYGPDGVGAAGAYMAITWIGIAVFVAVMIAWFIVENRRLKGRG